jgi:tetratricopeptide (TPR) repeat protein
MTVLCGAGVSVRSGLPDGQRLAATAFEQVAHGAGVFSSTATDAVLDERRKDLSDGPLRLELVLDLMAREVPAVTLAGVYTMTLGATPNRAHHILAQLDCPVITTNQDTLIEEAGVAAGRRADVSHLHGKASDLASVVTMLSQYVDDLPAATAAEFRSHLVARHLVVLGYSGRDRDIMPYLHHADRITWLQFDPPTGALPLSPEAEALQAHLGSRMTVVNHPDPQEWLYERLSPTRRRAVDAASHSAVPSYTASLTDEAVRAYRKIPLLDRRLAVARVLVHCNQTRDAYDGLLRCARSWPREPRVQLRIAAAAEVLQRRSDALRRFARVTASATDPGQRASAWLGRANVNANNSEHAAALAELVEATKAAKAVPEVRLRRRMLVRIANLRARIHAMTDGKEEAIRDYRRALELAERNHDLDGLVNSLIFGSDPLHSRGRYPEALRRLDRALEDNELYSRPHARLWGNYYRGLVLCSMREVTSGLSELQTCHTAARATGNVQAVAWATLTLGSYVRASDPVGARRLLDECRAAVGSYPAPMTVCEVRLEWEHAELARRNGELDDALERVDRLAARVAGPAFPLRLPYMSPHLLAIRAEIARERHDDAPALLREARNLYAAGKWRHSVARMEVAAWLSRGGGRPPRDLLDRCRRYGYRAEVDRLEGATTSEYYPLHSW